MKQQTVINFEADIRTKKNGKTARHSFRTGKTWMHRKAGAIRSESNLHDEASDQAEASGWRVTDRDCAVTLTFLWNGKADMIGLAETVLDAMQGVIYVNDKQVRVLVMSMLKKGQKTEGVTCQAVINEI